ncbi:hypothetical protein BV25DRAFT_521007 [Artomyces pyxidatus]|uniref:Uncharacterized protein n=1 Tax=Artomyces pyxidatus TaxID=48021 RepID=A0ACB8TI84_9AGAM|nr:hypothetical protein BV25DRAFT_521007 [Artomyces pyxidatus]
MQVVLTRRSGAEARSPIPRGGSTEVKPGTRDTVVRGPEFDLEDDTPSTPSVPPRRMTAKLHTLHVSIPSEYRNLYSCLRPLYRSPFHPPNEPWRVPSSCGPMLKTATHERIEHNLQRRH